MTIRSLKIKKLKDYFEKREDIVMAFLFSSRAEKNRTHHFKSLNSKIQLFAVVS